MFIDTLIIAAGAAPADPNAFWGTAIGGSLKALLVAAGIIVVIVTAVKAFKDITGGKPGNAAKTILGAAIIAAFLFRPELISTLITAAGVVVEKVISSFSDLIK